MSNTEQRDAQIKCPKCRGTKLMLDESILIVETSEIDGRSMSEVLDSVPVSTTGYRAECNSCGHMWKPRRDTVDSFRALTRATTS